jgi:hypothetical protein
MGFGRTILIFLIALSVAMLPAAGDAASLHSKSADAPDVSASMEAIEVMHDCCPPKQLPPQKAIDDCCSSMATCSMNCFGIAEASTFLILFPLLLGSLPVSFLSNPLRPQTANPPLRPPCA